MELKELSGSKLSQRLPRDVDAIHEANKRYDETSVSAEPNETAKQPKIRFGYNVKTMRCPYCRFNMTTKIEVRTMIWTHLSAALLFLLCMWPCIPCVYCSRNCLKQIHYCSNCNKYLGESGFFHSLRWRRDD